MGSDSSSEMCQAKDVSKPKDLRLLVWGKVVRAEAVDASVLCSDGLFIAFLFVLALSLTLEESSSHCSTIIVALIGLLYVFCAIVAALILFLVHNSLENRNVNELNRYLAGKISILTAQTISVVLLCQACTTLSGVVGVQILFHLIFALINLAALRLVYALRLEISFQTRPQVPKRKVHFCLDSVTVQYFQPVNGKLKPIKTKKNQQKIIEDI